MISLGEFADTRTTVGTPVKRTACTIDRNSV